MNKDHALTSERGFTLVEVLIALTIFAIGLLALASMQVTALRGNSNAQIVTDATALAEGTLEWLQSLPANDPLFKVSVAPTPVAGSPFTLRGGGTINVTYEIDTSVPVGSVDYPDGVVRIVVVADTMNGIAWDNIQLETLKWVR